jgi:hypothetical protein
MGTTGRFELLETVANSCAVEPHQSHVVDVRELCRWSPALRKDVSEPFVAARVQQVERDSVGDWIPSIRAGSSSAHVGGDRGTEVGTARAVLRTSEALHARMGVDPDASVRAACDARDMTTMRIAATPTIQRFHLPADLAGVESALAADGAVIIEGLLSSTVVSRVNDEVEAAAAAADPDGPMFNPIAREFMGVFTKNVPGVPGISRTFATEVMCHPLLLGLADRVLGPGCARFQLNLGQILERGPGSIDQWLHRDEGVWVDVPKPSPELQLASVIALVDFTAANGATRLVPGSHRWPDRHLAMDQQATPSAEQVVVAEMPAGSAVIYTGGVIHGGGANVTDEPRRAVHLSYCLGWLRTEENNYLSIPPTIAAALPRQAQEVLGYSVYDGIGRGGGYLGMVRMQDPVVLLANDEL